MIYQDPNKEPEKPLSQEQLIQKIIDYSNIIDKKNRQGRANYMPISIPFLQNMSDDQFMEFLGNENIQTICSSDTADYLHERVEEILGIRNLKDIQKKIKNIKE